MTDLVRGGDAICPYMKTCRAFKKRYRALRQTCRAFFKTSRPFGNAYIRIGQRKYTRYFFYFLISWKALAKASSCGTA